jgi:opacity protein-like surface antigen
MRKLIVIVGVLLVNCGVYADENYTSFNQPRAHQPTDAYLVFDAGYLNTVMVAEYKKMFRSNLLGFNLGLGYYFNQYFSLEVNHFWTDNLRKSFKTTIGTPFLGIMPFQNNVHHGQFRIASSALEFHYHIFKYALFKPFIGGGIVWSKQTINFKHDIPLSAVPGATETIITPLNSITGGGSGSLVKSKLLFRAVLGLDMDLTTNFGVRFLYRYDTISKVSVTSSIAALPLKPLNSGNYFSLGLFYSFCS